MRQIYLISAFLICFMVHSQNETIEQLTLKLAYQTKDSSKVDVSLQLIDELVKTKAYDKALLYINQTTDLSQKLNYTKGIAGAKYFKGTIYSEREDYVNAVENYISAKISYQQLNDFLSVAKTNNQIGLIEIKRGNYSTGLQNVLSAIKIFEDENLYGELSLAYSSLANAYYNTKQFDKALEYSNKALAIQEQIGDIKAIKESLITIAHIYFLEKNYTRSINFYERALNLLDEEQDQELKGELLPKIGMAYLKLNDIDKAGALLVESIRYNRRIENEKGILESLTAAATLNLKQKNYRTAENQIVEAYNIATQKDYQNDILENYKLRIALDSSRGRFQNAFYWQNKFYDLKEQLDENKPVASIPEDVPSEIVDIKSSETSSPPESKSKKNISNSILIYGLIAGLLVSLALLIFTYLNNLKNTKALELHKKWGEEKLKLEEENTKLKEINTVKDKLFSIVSHDLKDSISSIKTLLDLLKDEAVTKEEFDQLIPELSENANNASSLLFNLLNWSKSQLQNLNPKPELFNIQEVFQNKMALVDKKASDKGITIIDESRRDFVYADRSMLEIVIQNLIANAVKFSGKGDVITVSNQDYNGKALICVEDTGIGISKENIDKLFNARNNFTTIGTKNEKGTGLGLTIAKDLVELNNGRIWVESTPNIGSKFFIEIPKAAIEPKTSLSKSQHENA